MDPLQVGQCWSSRWRNHRERRQEVRSRARQKNCKEGEGGDHSWEISPLSQSQTWETATQLPPHSLSGATKALRVEERKKERKKESWRGFSYGVENMGVVKRRNTADDFRHRSLSQPQPPRKRQKGGKGAWRRRRDSTLDSCKTSTKEEGRRRRKKERNRKEPKTRKVIKISLERSCEASVSFQGNSEVELCPLKDGGNQVEDNGVFRYLILFLIVITWKITLDLRSFSQQQLSHILAPDARRKS